MKSCVLALAVLAFAGPVLAQAPTDTPWANPGPLGRPSPASCPPASPMLAQNPTPGAQPYRRLDQLPQAHLMASVLKSVNGCAVAVMKAGDRTYDAPLGGQRQVRREGVTRRMR